MQQYQTSTAVSVKITAARPAVGAAAPGPRGDRGRAAGSVRPRRRHAVSAPARRRRKPPAPDLAALLPSWELALRAERKSAETVKSYTAGVVGFIRWCEHNSHTPALDRDLVKGYVADLLADGAEASTARARQLAVRRFSAWLTDEGEIDTDPLLGLKAPKLDAKVTRSLTDDELRRLIKACSGKEFRDRRDEAIVRLMAETGTRAGEVCNIGVADLDLPRALVTVRRGKGGKGRVVPFSSQAARAIDRYLRARRSHRLADTAALWLGDRGKELAYFGLRNTLQYRAELAGIKGFHPHLLRHTAASRWLAAGGSEGGLMAVAGWSTRDMIDRYTRSTAAERAAAEARALGLGDNLCDGARPILASGDARPAGCGSSAARSRSSTFRGGVSNGSSGVAIASAIDGGVCLAYQSARAR